jgi:predicted peroxiredoxin
MKLLYLGSHGPEDPTHAALPLHMAKGAVEAGHSAEVVLQGNAALLFNETIVANVQPVGLPSLKELFAFLRDNRVPVFG